MALMPAIYHQLCDDCNNTTLNILDHKSTVFVEFYTYLFKSGVEKNQNKKTLYNAPLLTFSPT